MDDHGLSVLDRKFRQAGFGEGLPEMVRERIKQGADAITHHVVKRLADDELDVQVRLKRSADGTFYYLQGFDLGVRQQGQVALRNHQFSDSYTLTEGYNLLSGRPVLKTYGMDEDGPVQAWERLALDKPKLENGNFQTLKYPEDGSFDLGKALRQFPIRELANPKELQAVTDGLLRGDLAKVTLTGGDGKEVKLKVSPNIAMRSMTVYDENGQRIPTPKLLERQLIGGEKLKPPRQRTKHRLE